MVEIEYGKVRVKLGDTDLSMSLQKTLFYLLMQPLRKQKPGMRILEVGTGSGFVSAVLLANLKDISLVATEINPHAARCAKANGVEVIRTDLFRGIKPWKPGNPF